MLVSVLHASRPLGRLVRLPLRLVPRGTIVPVLAGPNRGTRWIVGAGPHSCWLGFNEWRKRRLFAHSIRPGMIVYDAGANVGSYTVLAARCVGPGGHVLAFEPAPENLPFLRRHLALNRATNVSVMEAAVWRRSGRVAFEPHPDRLQGRVSEKGGRLVTAVSLDDVIAAGWSAPHVVKIDVEGGELDVLEGARELLTSVRPLIFVATHSPALEQRVNERLREYGYAVTAIGRSQDEWLAMPGPTPQRTATHHKRPTGTESRRT